MSWKTPITLVVLIGVLLGAAYYGWRSLSASEDGASTTPTPSVKTPKCVSVEKFRKGERIRSEDVIVNVFNAGTTNGLATTTLDALVDKGFKRGEADNAPAELTATNVTMVRGQSDDPTVRLVAMQFRGPVEFTEGSDVAPGVDVAVGDDFVGVDVEAPDALRLKRQVSTCRSVTEPPRSTR